MSKVRVHKWEDQSSTSSEPALRRIEEISDAIRRRAFELFEERGSAPGGELDDWLRAEEDVLYVPHAEVNEAEAAYHITICAPGFEAEDIDVIALPHELLVEGKIECRIEPTCRNTEAGGLECRTLLRRFDLVAPIDVDAVTARIDEGTLTIEAPKAALSMKKPAKGKSQRVQVRTAAA
jgi:HSP20 family molecular chaperone IbpA